MQQQIDAKIILLGESGVGKTSLLNRYLNNQFTNTKATIGAFFMLKVWNGYNIGIWDTAGQEKYNALNTFYCRKTNAAILVYDITSLESFQHLTKYLDMLFNENPPDSLHLGIVGTKYLVVDNSDSRQVSQEEAIKFAERYKGHFLETSAKSGWSVDQIFDMLGKDLFGDTVRLTHSSRRTFSERKEKEKIISLPASADSLTNSSPASFSSSSVSSSSSFSSPALATFLTSSPPPSPQPTPAVSCCAR